MKVSSKLLAPKTPLSFNAMSEKEGVYKLSDTHLGEREERFVVLKNSSGHTNVLILFNGGTQLQPASEVYRTDKFVAVDEQVNISIS